MPHHPITSEPVTPMPFWKNVKADLVRFQENSSGARSSVRGLLSQGFQAIFVYRLFRWFYERGIPVQPVRFIVERGIEITTGISIPVQAKIGKGFRIHHFGNIIMHPETRIGEGCTVYQGVTIGDVGGYGGAPIVGNNTLIGAGAKLLGNISIGDNCIIGANAVVLQSVPSNSIAVGIPAVMRPRTISEPDLPMNQCLHGSE